MIVEKSVGSVIDLGRDHHKLGVDLRIMKKL